MAVDDVYRQGQTAVQYAYAPNQRKGDTVPNSLMPSTTALGDFQQARRRAAMRELIARLTGHSTDLLSFEDVRQKLKAQVSAKRELHDIPLDAIVGSVGRYSDFTRDFLPRKDSDAMRWAGVRSAIESEAGVPPIEVYKLGNAYFVLDGNHRVSVARETGATHIHAYVTDVQTRVPFVLGDSPDDLIIKAEYAGFLEATDLDQQRPTATLNVTAPGQYSILLEQIEAHREQMARQQSEAVVLPTAAADWYDTVYMPIIAEMRTQGTLHEFPGRSETDLYIWLTQHRNALEQSLGWQVGPKAAISDLASQHGTRNAVARLGGKLLDIVVPDTLEAGPPPGAWRQERGMQAYGEHLVSDLLVAINGEDAGWYALEQALLIARREQARLAGLHVVPNEAARQSAAVAELRAEFTRRCTAAGVDGGLAIDVGNVTRQICDRARLTDMVVVSLSYPPGTEPFARLRSGFRTLVQRCPRPILAVPCPAIESTRALLPYDGSPKAEEALFAATYLSLSWKLTLHVVTATEEADEHTVSAATLQRAREYLERHGVQASYELAEGPASDAILSAVHTHQSNLIVIGSYGFNPLVEIMLGSSVDQVLRESSVPVLLCR